MFVFTADTYLTVGLILFLVLNIQVTQCYNKVNKCFLYDRCKQEFDKSEDLMRSDIERLCGLSMFFGELFLILEVGKVTSILTLSYIQHIYSKQLWKHLANIYKWKLNNLIEFKTLAKIVCCRNINMRLYMGKDNRSLGKASI